MSTPLDDSGVTSVGCLSMGDWTDGVVQSADRVYLGAFLGGLNVDGMRLARIFPGFFLDRRLLSNLATSNLRGNKVTCTENAIGESTH